MSVNETVTMPEELREILSEPGWWSHEDGDLFLWAVTQSDNAPAVRVALEDGDWWVSCESDGYSVSDLDELVALTICMVRVHHAIGTPLGHFAKTFTGLAALAGDSAKER